MTAHQSQNPEERTIWVPHETLRGQVIEILSAWGVGEEDGRLIAEVMVETDLRAIDSHGISMLPLYDRMRSDGSLNLKPQPRVIREFGATALVDADAGLGHAVSIRAMHRAIGLSRQHGCGIVLVRNSHHFGAAGIYAEIAAKEGVVGFVTSATRFITMVPTYGAEPVLGTNPLAFAAPAGSQPPVLLDMATTSAAGNKVKAYWLKNREIPPGWVVDAKGETVTDSREANSIIFERPEGGLTPLGGTPEGGSYKGYGLALMVHVLSAVLAGASFSPLRNRTQGRADPDDIGHFFMAVNPEAFRDAGEFESDMDEVLEVLRDTRPVDPDQPVLVAGDPERAAREERLKTGIPLPPRLQEQLKAVAANSGVEYRL